MKNTLLSLLIVASGPLLAADPLATAASRFAAFEGAKVHYKSVGEGKTAVVFVHGFACDLTSWRLQAPAFDGRVRAIYVDLPGFGQSDKPDVSYTTVRFARALDAVLADAGVEQAVLVGHSMGTPVVREYARQSPKRTKALVAVDGALKSFGMKKEQVDFMVSAYEKPTYKETIGAWVDTMFTKDTPADLKQQTRATMQGVKQSVAISAMRNMLDESAFKGDDPIAVPLLVVNARSPFWTADYEAHVRKISSSVDYQVIEGAGHFVMMDKAEAFNALVGGFLTKLGVMSGTAKPLAVADPKDVSSVDAILAALYDVISGPPEKKRDWDRLRSLFVDGARMIPVVPRQGEWGARVTDVNGYIERSAPFFAKEGFFEREVARRTETFGHVVHAFSTYEARKKSDDKEPFLRGINSIQLVNDGKRWAIVTVMWEAESEAVKLPPKYLTK